MAYGWIVVLVWTGIVGVVQGQEETLMVQYKIQEEIPEDTWIGNIASSLSLNASAGAMEFGFLSESDPTRVYFSICCGGELRTRGRYDRDTLCAGSMEPCVLSVDVTVKIRDEFSIAKVLVEVEDIEDNAPQFPTSQHELMVSESTQPLASFSLPVASDADASPLSYTLTPELSEFALRVSGGECHLVVRAALDREQRAAYALVLAARDAAGNTARLQLQLSVTDVNDNAPHFLPSSEYAVSVLESVGVGATLLHVNALDPDAGDNGRVRYSLSPQAEAALGDVFRVDALTGAVLLLAPLNYGRRSQYVLRVAAHDGGSSSLAAYATVTVSVQDLNDHAPHIRINALTAVTEHAAPGAFVAHVSVEDDDGGDNGKCECSLDHDSFSLLKVFGTEYKIVTAASLDRESRGQYQVRVLCRDLGSPPQEATELVDITVQDINDHAPRFERSMYEVNISEDTTIGTTLLTVLATDLDSGDNARIQYSLRGSCTSVLTINPSSGSVRISRALDHEERSVWDCQLLATDHGTDPTTSLPARLSAASTLRLAVRDVNDEAPHFPAPRLTLSVRENRAPGAGVGDVVAYDRDAPPHNILSYRLSEPSDSFSISPRLGSLRTTKSLDRELKDSYIVHVIASDQDGLSSEVEVIIMVQDMNDNAPVIQIPSTPLQVSSAARIGHIITHIRATDADTSHNAQLRYSILAASTPDLFSINPLSGAVSVADDLTDFIDSTISITFRVQDRGEPVLEAIADFKFFINSTVLPLGSSDSGDVISNSSLIIILLLSFTAVISFILILIIVILIRRRKRFPSTIDDAAVPPSSKYDTAAGPSTVEKGQVNPINTVDGEMQRINNLNYANQNQENAQKSRRVHFKEGIASRNGGRGYEASLDQLNDLGAGQADYKEESRHRLLYGPKSNSTQNLQGPPPPSRHHPGGLPGPLDQEWERGSLDSGRGASEEENTSSEAVPVHGRSRGQPPRSGARSSGRAGARSLNPGRCKSYPDSNRAEGGLNRGQSSRQDNQGQSRGPRGQIPSDDQRNIIYTKDTAPPIPRRVAPPTKSHAKPPAPEPPIQGLRSRAADTLDNTLDSQATTMSGEYVLNLPQQQPSDVYV